MSDVPFLNPSELLALAQARPTAPCPACAALVCPGWESLPGGFDAGGLRLLGTLRHPEDEDPRLDEFHPAGTHTWSADAPIAPTFHPYNRAEVWGCAACGRPFLRYTEYGGYYKEDRIRQLQAALIAA